MVLVHILKLFKAANTEEYTVMISVKNNALKFLTVLYQVIL